MTKQQRYTKNIKIEMYLCECEHEAELVQAKAVFCRTCQKVIDGKFVGTILASLDRDGFLTAKGPLLKVTETAKVEGTQ